MTTLFCDLDNTIIYSYRRELNAPKRVAEMLNGFEQSYITESTFSFLSACKSVNIIPVTTRTIHQYERVKHIIDCFNCKYVLVLNGAVLIKEGVIDESWLAQSIELAKIAAGEMHRVATMLENEKMAKVKYHDAFLVYASTSRPEMLSKQIEKTVNSSLVSSFFDSRKVYCVPQVLNKGNAISRLSNYLSLGQTLAVGDSENDISMFENVDIPIVPSTLGTQVSNINKVVISETKILSDATCDVIEKLIGP